MRLFIKIFRKFKDLDAHNRYAVFQDDQNDLSKGNFKLGLHKLNLQ